MEAQSTDLEAAWNSYSGSEDQRTKESQTACPPPCPTLTEPCQSPTAGKSHWLTLVSQCTSFEINGAFFPQNQMTIKQC